MNQVDRGVRELSFVNCCLAAIRVSCQPKRSIKATAHRAGYDPFVAPSSFELTLSRTVFTSGPSPTHLTAQRCLPLAPSTHRNLTLAHCVCHIEIISAGAIIAVSTDNHSRLQSIRKKIEIIRKEVQVSWFATK
jgi:hypothetical protein